MEEKMLVEGVGGESLDVQHTRRLGPPSALAAMDTPWPGHTAPA